MKTAFKSRRALLCAAAILALCALLLSSCKEPEDKYASPTEKFFVNDFAGVISEEHSAEIQAMGETLQQRIGAQAVVVTVKSTEGEEISDFATTLGRNWGIGEKDKNNGVIVLLATEDRKIYIAVGYGLEGVLPDSKTGRLLDKYAIPYLKQNDFSSGVAAVYKAAVNEIYVDYGMTYDADYTPLKKEAPRQNTPSVKAVIISWVIMFAVAFLFALFARKRGIRIFMFPRGPRGFGGGFGGFGGFGGSGFGGGGFRGGGGSFGGGGAGRGF